MRLIDPSLVGITRNLVASQGFNPLIVNSDGSLNPDGVLAMFFNQVEVQTSATPPLRFPIGPSGEPTDPATDALVKTLKPTVILSGPAGRVVVAPYGSEPATSWLPIIIAGGATVALIGWLVFGRRS